MNQSKLELIEKWQSDPSFINWAQDGNEEDVAKWNNYLEMNPEYQETAEVAKFSLVNIRPKPVSRDLAKSRAALANLQGKITPQARKQKTTNASVRYFKTWQIAASILMIVVAGIWGYSVFNDQGDLIVWETFEEQKELNLTDGTKVILNAHSTLRYFEKEVRKIELDGEAYFEVAKKAETNASFQVKTKDLLVTVLGTEFNVNSQAGQTSVYLDEGKVKLSLGEQTDSEIEMKPGELVTYSRKQNKVLENRQAASLSETAWKEKVVLFEEAPLAEVLQTISLVYGITFDTNLNDDKDQLFSGGVPVNDLDITLQTLKDIFQLDIKKIEEKYLLE